jgi:hypothetical protein
MNVESGVDQEWGCFRGLKYSRLLSALKMLVADGNSRLRVRFKSFDMRTILYYKVEFLLSSKPFMISIHALDRNWKQKSEEVGVPYQTDL